MNPEALAETLQGLIERGFRPPFTWTMVAANGAVLAGRMEPNEAGSLSSTIIAQHGEALAAPINAMFVDRFYEAVHVVFHGTEN